MQTAARSARQRLGLFWWSSIAWAEDDRYDAASRFRKDGLRVLKLLEGRFVGSSSRAAAIELSPDRARPNHTKTQLDPVLLPRLELPTACTETCALPAEAVPAQVLHRQGLPKDRA